MTGSDFQTVSNVVRLPRPAIHLDADWVDVPQGVRTIDLLHGLPSVRPLFEALTPIQAMQVDAELEWYPLESGEILFHQHDVAEDAFIMMSGSLGAFIGNERPGRLIGKVGDGEVVGGTAFLTGSSRAATMIALERSMLVRMPQSTIELLVESSPEVASFVLRMLRKATSVAVAPQSPGTIAIVALQSSIRFGDTFDAVTNPRTICIRTTAQEQALRSMMPGLGDLLLYVAEDPDSAWARHCMSVASHIVFVAHRDSRAANHEAMAFADRLHRDRYLAVLQDDDATQPEGGSGWLQHFAATQILHVRPGRTDDWSRALRLASRRGLCAVFSGGGARALAHVGALIAFEEKGIPIDATGGTSMGAVIAALVAQGRTPIEILNGMREYFVENDPISDYTLPVVSLVRGELITRVFDDVFADTSIENMWKPFFCVSSDLTSRAKVIHRSGPVSLAVRASTAIPGVLPPVIADGHVLVDGAIMDNFPTTIMRSTHAGRIVGIDVSSSFSIAAADIAAPDDWWSSLVRQLSWDMPSLLRILMSSAVAGSDAQLINSHAAADVLIKPRLDDIGLLSFKDFDRAVEAGYRAALEAIPQLAMPAEKNQALNIAA